MDYNCGHCNGIAFESELYCIDCSEVWNRAFAVSFNWKGTCDHKKEDNEKAIEEWYARAPKAF